MRIFLDTGSLADVQKVIDAGLKLDGVTTNPSLLAKTYAGKPGSYLDITRDFVGLGVPDISEETIGCKSYNPIHESAQTYVEEAMIIHGINERVRAQFPNLPNPVTVKIPATKEGLRATRIVAGEGVRVNSTLIFTPEQAEMAAMAGAAYASPFVGRLDDMGRDGIALVNRMVMIYQDKSYATQVLTASVRELKHVDFAYQFGSHIVTLPFSVFAKLDIDWLKRIQEPASTTPEKPVDFRTTDLEGAIKANEDVFWHPKLIDGMFRFLKDGEAADVRQRILTSAGPHKQL